MATTTGPDDRRAITICTLRSRPEVLEVEFWRTVNLTEFFGGSEFLYRSNEDFAHVPEILD